MDDRRGIRAAGNGEPSRTGLSGVCVLVLLALYAAGLTHGMSRPWTGMHDWNGAFFSQLARNCLRYPASVHHGIPLVAVGEMVPPPKERSIYATHPPGLVWLVATVFWTLGEAEWVARLVPVACSLGTLGLLVRLLQRQYGRETALMTGLMYSVMPMAVYFGRMVDHEAVCLFLMLGALASWGMLIADGATRRHRRLAWSLWVVSVWGAVWVDWVGIVFAGLFCVLVTVQRRRGEISRRRLAWGWAVPLTACAAMLAYLVPAGLDGRWGDLWAIFLSRTTESPADRPLRDISAQGGPWRYWAENLTWPMIALSIIGLMARVVQAWRGGWVVPGRARNDRESRRTSGLWVVNLTGLIWLTVFWRQYARHNYWLFYLGPAVALASAHGVSLIRDRLRRGRPRVADGVMYVLLMVVAAMGLRGVDDYFARVSYSPDEIRAWREIHRQTRVGDRVLLFEDPVRIEHRGQYRFRNVIPPQLAYYLDRPFDVERDLRTVARRSSGFALYVMPVDGALAHGEALARLRTRFPERQVWTKVLFDFRHASEADRPGERDDRPPTISP